MKPEHKKAFRKLILEVLKVESQTFLTIDDAVELLSYLDEEICCNPPLSWPVVINPEKEVPVCDGGSE